MFTDTAWAAPAVPIRAILLRVLAAVCAVVSVVMVTMRSLASVPVEPKASSMTPDAASDPPNASVALVVTSLLSRTTFSRLSVSSRQDAGPVPSRKLKMVVLSAIAAVLTSFRVDEASIAALSTVTSESVPL